MNYDIMDGNGWTRGIPSGKLQHRVDFYSLMARKPSLTRRHLVFQINDSRFEKDVGGGCHEADDSADLSLTADLAPSSRNRY